MTLPSGTPPGSCAANHPYEKLRSEIRRPFSELTYYSMGGWLQCCFVHLIRTRGLILGALMSTIVGYYTLI